MMRTTLIAYWLWRAKEALGESLHRLGFPGRLRSLRLEDALVGQSIVIDATPAFTRVTVNGQQYYYRHLVWSNDPAGRNLAPALKQVTDVPRPA